MLWRAKRERSYQWFPNGPRLFGQVPETVSYWHNLWHLNYQWFRKHQYVVGQIYRLDTLSRQKSGTPAHLLLEVEVSFEMGHCLLEELDSHFLFSLLWQSLCLVNLSSDKSLNNVAHVPMHVIFTRTEMSRVPQTVTKEVGGTMKSFTFQYTWNHFTEFQPASSKASYLHKLWLFIYFFVKVKWVLLLIHWSSAVHCYSSNTKV